MDKERDQLLRDMRVEVVWTDKATMSIPLYERMKDYIARARVDKGEVETHITDMEIAHDMSHTAFCDEGHWRDEFIAAKEKAIAGLSSKPVEADTELTRLKRQVEVLSRGLRGLRETTTDNISEVRAENALAAAERIGKGEV